MVSVEGSSKGGSDAVGLFSQSVRSKTPVSMERSKCLDEDEAVIAICMGNLPYDGAVMNEYEETGHVGEADLTGCTMMT
ncbi:hypothetical protein V6N11_057467 [Hibiscus sabdariffa]|uniref:Uncharacterized protein n=1 Tax=Hibiscus sabdariffa TaxID=183260 RepID=A0ABR2NGR5_9ROSI